VDGAANRALAGLLAGELGLPRSAVRIVGGETSRTKVVEADGLTPGVVEARWPGLAC
jgi:uncharacterized protein YggU (UPF0235/DUF167 family)